MAFHACALRTQVRFLPPRPVHRLSWPLDGPSRRRSQADQVAKALAAGTVVREVLVEGAQFTHGPVDAALEQVAEGEHVSKLTARADDGQMTHVALRRVDEGLLLRDRVGDDFGGRSHHLADSRGFGVAMAQDDARGCMTI
jgi:hypothetical protein